MTEIFDRSRRRVPILENAFNILEEQRINVVWYLHFSLPYDDPKSQFCQPFCYVRRDGGELYRIMPATMAIDETGRVAYQCEHVLATLIDLAGNLGTYTSDVIRYVLGHQLVKNWVLGECDYRNQFEYGWEQESLPSAPFSVATPLAGPYIWRTDTSVYPWRLSLKRLDTSGRPEMYIRRRHNMTSYQREQDTQNIVIRLYPLGYGEGANQLGIGSVNGGVPYLQSPKAITDKYDIIEWVWTDRRYEDAASLKAAASAMLEVLQEPFVSYSIGYQEIGQSDFDRAAVGKQLRIIYPEIGEFVDTYITEVNRDYSDMPQFSIVVANRKTSIASSLADMADRQRIDQTYAQGATQIYSQTLQANCDAVSGAVMDFFIPEEMRIINKVLVKVRMSEFRAYSKSTASAGSSVVTSSTSDDRTSSGGGTGVATSSSGGGGGVTTDTGESGINVVWGKAYTSEAQGRYHTFDRVHSHQHEVTLEDHTHLVMIGDHTHTVGLSNHAHSITIPGHRHEVGIPSHAHEITPGHLSVRQPAKLFRLYRKHQKGGVLRPDGGTRHHGSADRFEPQDPPGTLAVPRGAPGRFGLYQHRSDGTGICPIPRR